MIDDDVVTIKMRRSINSLLNWCFFCLIKIQDVNNYIIGVTNLKHFKSGIKILIGKDLLKSELKNRKKAFVVSDPFLVKNNGISYVTDFLDEIGMQFEVYSEIAPDPDIEIVAKGIKALAGAKADTIIGFGGGSAIDACKAMMYFAEKENLVDDLKFIAIPTTSGTGSEATEFAVITNADKGIKYPIIDEKLLPDVAVLDANLTLTVPKEITAATGMDVLTHAIEALVSKEATDFSDACAEKAIKLVRSHLINAYNNPSDMVSRQGMHNASCLAGIAFNNSNLGLNHGMAHALGGRFHIPHGKANGILLPYVIGFNAGCFDRLNDNSTKYARIARLIYVDSSSIRQSSLNLIRMIKRTNERIGIPESIKAAGVPEEEFKNALDEMSRAALADGCTKTNPRDCSLEEIKSLFTHAYFGIVAKKFD